MIAKQNFTLAEKRILIVDDQKSFQTLLKGMLMQLGARNIHYVDSAESALATFNHEKYDLVFIDYNLGQGKNGRQLLSELKAKNKLTPQTICMMITGENNRAMVLGVVEVEPDDYLIKPFSQGLLKQRILKIVKRKEVLAPALTAANENNFETGIQILQAISEKYPRYRQVCNKLVCQSYFKTHQFSLANDLLISLLSSERSNWILVYLAYAALNLKKYQDAIKYCDQVLGKNRFQVEALDIKAQALQGLNQIDESLFVIWQSSQISPYSITRQNLVANIAFNAKDYDKYVDATERLLAMTERSVFADLSIQLNYIRALFLAAEFAEKDTQHQFINRLQVSLLKAKKNSDIFEELPFTIFEKLCKSRIFALKNQYIDAKQLINQVQSELENNDCSLPKEFLPESIMTLYDIGEFEAAKQQVDSLSQEDMPNNLNELLALKSNKMKARIENFETHNNNGIRLYKTNEFYNAIKEFEMALQYAPTNTGSSLNLLQALLQLLPHQKSDRVSLLKKCESTFATIEKFQLPEQHKKRFIDLQNEYQRIRAHLNT